MKSELTDRKLCNNKFTWCFHKAKQVYYIHHTNVRGTNYGLICNAKSWNPYWFARRIDPLDTQSPEDFVPKYSQGYYWNSVEVANEFNEFFASVGDKIAKQSTLLAADFDLSSVPEPSFPMRFLTQWQIYPLLFLFTVSVLFVYHHGHAIQQVSWSR